MIDKAFFVDTRPWKVESGSIYTADGTPIAHMDRVTGNGTSPTERDQNAHLIVDAVNAYDVEAGTFYAYSDGYKAAQKNEQERIAKENRQAQETRHALRQRLDRVEFALADIRGVLKDQNHSGTAYEQEKLAERDNLLGEYTKIKTQLLLIG